MAFLVEEVTKLAQTLILAIKPQDMDYLFSRIGKSIYLNLRVISFASDKTTVSIEKYPSEGVPVIHIIPSTYMTVGVGASAVSVGKYAIENDVKAVEELLTASRKTVFVEESLQDGVTTTSGSGPGLLL